MAVRSCPDRDSNALPCGPDLWQATSPNREPAMMPPDQLPAFAKLIGIVVKELTPDRVRAEITVTEDHNNRYGIMHGGALMALADHCGGMATSANLRPDQITTTIES